ncbi:MAG: ABC transporter permease, partial [Methanothrix soehngenii]
MLNEGRKKGGALSYIIALLAIFALNFILPRMMPGDPLQAIYGDEALVAMTPQMEAHLTELFALDKSWSEQMVAYVLALLQGNLGFSYYYKDEVSSVIMGALPWTLLLVGLSLLIATVVGVMLGIESGYRRGERMDRGLLAGLMLLGGLPHFFLGIVLLLIFG